MISNVRTASALIEAKLSEIDGHSDVGLLVEESWEKNQGQQCTGVAWDSFDVSMLSAIACGIGGKALASKNILNPPTLPRTRTVSETIAGLTGTKYLLQPAHLSPLYVY